MNDSSLENKIQVINVVAEAIRRYECTIIAKTKVGQYTLVA